MSSLGGFGHRDKGYGDKRNKSMPTGKGPNKHDSHKKPLNKGYSTASWEERLASKKEEEDDGNITDPELLAEKEYAKEHGIEFNMNLAAGGGLAVAAAAAPGPNPIDKAKKDALISAKAKQAKADRKARGRGVSGSMCKKDKAIACGGFHTLMDMDVYYGLEDEYDNDFMSDSEEPFEGHEDGYEGASSGKQGQAEEPKIDLVNDDMKKMSFSDEEEDRPGPSRPRPGTSGDGKPKRLYRF